MFQNSPHGAQRSHVWYSFLVLDNNNADKIRQANMNGFAVMQKYMRKKKLSLSDEMFHVAIVVRDSDSYKVCFDGKF